jgi:FtsP/CotA-like multicopper oxidase with cupredoxin domain
MRKARTVLAAALAVVATLGAISVSPAQQSPRRVINMSMTSWKFAPEIVQFNEGDTVVINLSNDDPLPRPHDITSVYFANVEVKTTGAVTTGKRQDDGRTWYRLPQGQKGTIEFVARGRGTAVFLCSVFDHATRGMTGAFNVTAAGTTIR